MLPKIRLITILFLFVAFAYSRVLGQYAPNSWASEGVTSIGVRTFGASFSIGSSIYVGTGHSSYFGSVSYLKDFWQFNTTTNLWTQLANFPGSARKDAIGFSVNGVGYVGLGDSGASYFFDMYRYNPTTYSWDSVAPLPAAAKGTAGAVCFVINGKAYVCLGQDTSRYNYLFEYDPASNTWASKSPFPDKRSNAVGFVIDNIAYVGTGNDGSSSHSDFYAYSPVTDAWTAISPLPGGNRAGGVAFSICGYGYAGLGIGNDFYQYDPLSDAWTTMASYPGINTSGYLYGSFTGVEDTGYAFIGFGQYGGGYCASELFRYSPPEFCISNLGINNFNSEKEFDIYPNPSTSNLTVISKNKITDIIILDIFGRTMLSGNYNTDTAVFNIEDWPAGQYFIKVNNIFVKRFVKK